MGVGLSFPVASKLLRFYGNDVLRIASAEMQGYRVNMEDALTIDVPFSDKHSHLMFFGVFDGHSGDAASVFASKNLKLRLAEAADPTDPETLKSVVTAFDKEFVEKAEVRTNGSTAVFALVRTEGEQYHITVGNIGDSRAVLIRKNGSHEALTTDHKPDLAEERDRIIRAGGSVAMNRVDGELAMSRAIGDWNYKCNPGLAAHEQKVIAVPDITTTVGQRGDMLLIACDGIFEAIDTPKVAQFLYEQYQQHPRDPAYVASSLLDHSLKQGSKDNMTAIIIYLDDGVGYGREDLFVAGPFEKGKTDQQFVEAYRNDAAKHGISPERLDELSREADQHDTLGLPSLNAGEVQQRASLEELIAQAIASVENPPDGGQEE